MKFWENGQRPRGRWETVAGTSGRLIGRYQCSCCGECRELATATLARYKYCPNCGAAMDGTVEKALLHSCKERHPECLCTQCKHDVPGSECCAWLGKGHSVVGICPVSECSNFAPEEARV